jgi:hypothetical protein
MYRPICIPKFSAFNFKIIFLLHDLEDSFFYTCVRAYSTNSSHLDINEWAFFITLTKQSYRFIIVCHGLFCVCFSKRKFVQYINRSQLIAPKFLYVNYYENENASSNSDIDRYVIIAKLLDFIFNILPVFVC